MYTANTFPYYDDFDASKGYHRVLFRPGRAVQARELTQLQSVLQNQISTLGRHLFREGSLAFPGEPIIYRANIDFVKLATSYNGVDSDDVIAGLVGQKITSNNDITATIIAAKPSTDTDPPTVYVTYESRASDKVTKFFTNGQILTQYVNGNANVELQTVAAGNVTGQGTAVGLSDNYIFIKDNFVKLNKELVIVDKYNKLTSNSIGFRVFEDIVTYADDSSLRDPAVLTEGSADSNFYAIGADRYRIRVTLESRKLLDDTDDTDPEFFEFIRVIDGNPSWVRDEIIYDVLSKELAKRTYEESGDYVVDCFPLQLMEHSNSSNVQITGYYTSNGLSNAMVALMGPGLAYVKGFRNETKYHTPLTVYKPRDSANLTTTVNLDTGTYILVDSVIGFPNLVTDLERVDLHDKYKSNWLSKAGGGSKIGAFRVRHMELFSGTPGTASAQYKLYPFELDLINGFNVRSIKSIKGTGVGSSGFAANIVPSLALLTGSVSTTIGSNVISGLRTGFEIELADPTDNTTFSDVVTIRGATDQVLELVRVQGNNVAISNTNATSNVSGAPIYVHYVNLLEQTKYGFLYKLPYENIKSVDSNNTSTVFTAKAFATATLAANVATITLSNAVNETWQTPTNEGSLLMVTSGTKAGNIYPAASYITRSGNQKTLTIDLSAISGVATSDIVVMNPKVKVLDKAARRTKTLTANATYDITNAAIYGQDVIKLNKADAIKIVSISEAALGSVSYSTIGAKDITDNYTFFNGQYETHYDLSRIIRKPKAPVPQAPIRITFDHYTHGGSGDYFSVDSYTDTGINYADIPSFKHVVDGELYLSDVIDARPVVNNAGSGYSGAGSVKPDFFETTDSFVTDVEYYLARNAMINIDNTGKFNIKFGASAPYGQTRDPEIPDDSMPLYAIRMKPYVRNIDRDVNIENMCITRFTMKDIGKLERRITNLEYYTSLSLLEKQTESLQIQDEYGLDRFKNGFIVDNFTGFGVADTTSTVAIDFRTNELRPKFTRKTF